MINEAMYPIAMAQNTGNFKIFVQEEGDRGAKLSFDSIDAIVQYDHPNNAGRGFIVRLSENEFLCAGLGAIIHFSMDGGIKIPQVEAVQGKFIDEKWLPSYRLAREREPWDPIRFLDCRIVKITLDIN